MTTSPKEEHNPVKTVPISARSKPHSDLVEFAIPNKKKEMSPKRITKTILY